MPSTAGRRVKYFFFHSVRLWFVVVELLYSYSLQIPSGRIATIFFDRTCQGSSGQGCDAGRGMKRGGHDDGICLFFMTKGVMTRSDMHEHVGIFGRA